MRGKRITSQGGVRKEGNSYHMKQSGLNIITEERNVMEI